MNDATPAPVPTGITVAELGEERLLARILPLLPTGDHTLIGPGDDAAVVATPDGRFVVSTDVLVEGRHFRSDWSDGRAVGRRAAAQNLADVAAMGARPTALVVSLVIPGTLPVSWVEGLAQGLAEVAGPVGAGVVGGDLSGGDAVVVAVTVHGDLDGRPPVLRSGAQPGDVVALAGTVGRSAAGLALLSAGEARAEDDELVDRYRAPRPPLAAGPLAAQAGATAMLDVSDGLLRDAGRIARASGVVLDLDRPEEALAEDLEAVRSAADSVGADPVAWVLTGGEDHGLLATFPGQVPAGFRVIGHVRAGEPTVLVAGRAPAVGGLGWDHFGG
ncbi:thiamine-phosphate kinase [Cellulomonas sp. NPDC089187]|uniref:thiamine-phosphate kinase n=1 Tax=Cellulomonas sp. NPDC089187 TaxID=3154970 RepID=UPI00342F011E